MKISETIAPRNDGGAAQGGSRLRMLTGWPAAASVLALFWIFMVASLRDKSLTFDEVVYAASGYAQWHYGDYRIQPENGQLAERVAGLPMELSLAPIPAPDPESWRNADQWQLGGQWIYRKGGDAEGVGFDGRMACGLFAVALGALVWAWSRRLFGPVGGMVSLLLYVLNPTVLANGALMTSDMAASLLFAAMAWAIWAVLHRLTAGRLLLSALLLGALFVTKASALLALPIAMVLTALRLADGRPLPVSLWGYRREVASRTRQCLAIAGAGLFHMLVIALVIWACYGFRYSAAPSDSPSGRFRIPWEYLLGKPDPASALQALGLSDAQAARARSAMVAHGAAEPLWTNNALDAVQDIRLHVLTPEQGRQLDAILSKPSPVPWVRMVETARARRLLPEAWIYGFTDVYRRAQVRVAFLNGAFRLRGWATFFPYTFLVKTPPALFGVALLAVASAFAFRPGTDSSPRTGPWMRVYATLPLWTLLAVYWAAAIESYLNIGHRHLLPAYAPMLILCGAAGLWADSLISASRGGRGAAPLALARTGSLALGALLLLALVDTVRIFPNYLAYFNAIVPPGEGYRHLVDSSLDWGQELPAIRAYVDRQPAGGGPIYLSYFGAASPDYYGIRATQLYSVTGMDGLQRPDWKTLFIAPEEVASTLPDLKREWVDHDLLGMQRLGDVVALTLLRKPEALRIRAGTYLISASMLQPINYPLDGPWGPWNARYEGEYQRLFATVGPLMSDDGAARRAGIVRHSVAEWPRLLQQFEEYRFGRLSAFLRQRKPDGEINSSVLVYHLSEADMAAALEGPAPELGPEGDRAASSLPE